MPAEVKTGGPAERIAKAIEGRDPRGYTEVFAADVAALEERIVPEKDNGVPSALVKGAKRAMKGGRGRSEDVVVFQGTGQLAQLLGALKTDGPVR